MSRAGAEVKCLSDLSDPAKVESMLKGYFQRSDVKILDAGSLEQFLGNNDFFNSEMRKVSVMVR